MTTKNRNETPPKEAFEFRSPLHFAEETDAGDGKKRIELTGITAHRFRHWWWGDTVFDVSGFKKPGRNIPVDFNHDDNEAIGYVDEITTGTDRVKFGGYLTPFRDGDRASEIIAKSKSGVPYQCSVSLRDVEYERLADKNTFAVVNGVKMSGPLTIFRKYVTDGIAVCLYGSNPNTTSSIFKKGNDMSIDHNSGTEESKTESTPQSEDGRAVFKKFSEMFGNERAGKYFAAGYDEARAKEEFLKELSEENRLFSEKIREQEAALSAARKENEDLKTGMASFKQAGETQNTARIAARAEFKGEPEPVSGNHGAKDVPPEANKFSVPVSENLVPMYEHIKSTLNL
jgi:hypothetical protein